MVACRRALKIILFTYMGASVSLAQNSALLGKNCDLAILGLRNKDSVLQFDRELRHALSDQDAGIIALLVKPSLRVNDAKGTFYIQDARSLQLRFQSIFNSSLRDSVLREKPEDLTCVSGGLSYGSGTVWVVYSGGRLAISAVNVPDQSPSEISASRAIEFVCNAEKHRVIIDAVGTGPPRYRAWEKPHSVLKKPDLEIAKGRRQLEGTGDCAHTTWTFTTSDATYYLQGPDGCYEQGHEPPPDSNGSLNVSIANKPDIRWWRR